MHSEKVVIRQARTTPSSAASNCLQIMRRKRRRKIIKIHRPQQLHDPPHYFCFSLSSETCSSKQYWTIPSPHMSVLLNIYPFMASKIKNQSRQNRRQISSAIVHLDDTIHRAQKIIWSRVYWNLPSLETKVLNIMEIVQLWFLKLLVLPDKLLQVWSKNHELITKLPKRKTTDS